MYTSFIGSPVSLPAITASTCCTRVGGISATAGCGRAIVSSVVVSGSKQTFASPINFASAFSIGSTAGAEAAAVVGRVVGAVAGAASAPTQQDQTNAAA